MESSALRYVKDNTFKVSLYDLKDIKFKVSFDLSKIDFIKILNDLRAREDIRKYLEFRKKLNEFLVDELSKAVVEESKNKILEVINEYVGKTGILEKPAKDIEIVGKGYESGEIYFIIKPIF
ncbi:MAG: hypothetical protein QXW13_00055 [Nanopusillaceae archaeon]